MLSDVLGYVWVLPLLYGLALLSLGERQQRRSKERSDARKRQWRNLEVDIYARAGEEDYLRRLLIADLRALWAKRYVEQMVDEQLEDANWYVRRLERKTRA